MDKIIDGFEEYVHSNFSKDKPTITLLSPALIKFNKAFMVKQPDFKELDFVQVVYSKKNNHMGFDFLKKNPVINCNIPIKIEHERNNTNN